MDDIKDAEHMTGHFFSSDGTRMEASYVRYAHLNGQWAYYKLPGSERKCECAVEPSHDLSRSAA